MATRVLEHEISDALIEQWERACQKLVALAAEIPEDKFSFKPTASIRSVAEVLRHVAFWNRYLADSVRDRKADDAANELPKDAFSTKMQIVGALKDSGTDAADALKENRSVLSWKQIEMAIGFIGHNCEHYGQLVVYARLNSIIPPATRE